MTTTEGVLGSVDWKGHRKALADAVTPQYLDLLELGWDQELAGDFALTNPHVKDAVKLLGKRIVGISETTREDMKGVLERTLGADKIPSTAEIARQLREYGVTSSVSRSQMIARTESAVGLNHGAIASYREAGVERVQVLDGDGDEECAAADGQTWTLDEAMDNPTAHPNCTRAFSPIVD